MRVLAILAALVVAGCASPGPEAAGAPEPLPWGIEGCAFVIVAIPVDEAALAGRLPPGFALRPGRLGALPAGPRASIEVDAYRCTSARWGNATLEDASYGSYYAAVTPPEALREEGYDAVFVKWEALVADPATRAQLAASGLAAHGGDAQVSATGNAVTASLAFDDGGGFRFTGTVGPPQALAEPLPFVEFTPLAEGGLARWHARLHDASIGQGAGVVELPAGWVREIVGAERAPATFIAGTWNLDEADLTLPIAWP